MGIRCADHVTPLYPQKLALTSPTDGGRSVGIVRSRTKATEFSLGLYVESECLPSMQQESKYKCVSSINAISAFINKTRASHLFWIEIVVHFQHT